jgi:hypothetical protein
MFVIEEYVFKSKLIFWYSYLADFLLFFSSLIVPKNAGRAYIRLVTRTPIKLADPSGAASDLYFPRSNLGRDTAYLD